MRKTLQLILFTISYSIIAQPAQQQVFEFFNLSNSARLTGLGTYNITTKGGDVAMNLTNPAMIDSVQHNALAFNYNFHVADIGHISVDYGYFIPKWALATHFNIQKLNFGTFEQTDLLGNNTGEFTASDVVVNFGFGKKLNERFNAGINLKYISSRYESYSSSGFGLDFGVNYYDPQSRFDAALVIKNVGTQFTPYNNTKEQLPIDVQFGLSKRLAHLPFRVSITAIQLNNWNLYYNNPYDNQVLFIGKDQPSTSEASKFIDNFFRHIVVGGEFMFGSNENFALRFAYNYGQKKELSVNNFRSLAGFSAGFGFKISKFRIDYGFESYHLAGGSNHFSITTNINNF
jgi:hypothetical protein